VEALELIAAIVMAAYGSVLLVRHRWLRTDRVLDGAARRRVAGRIAEITGPRPRSGSASASARDGSRNPGSGVVWSRRHLLRDASGTLTVLGAGLIAVLVVTQREGPVGSVLEATATSPPSVARAGSEVAASPGIASAVNPAPTLAAAAPEATRRPDPTGAPPTERPSAVSARLAVLTPCSGQRGCYVYRVRLGDNLSSIANWFGIPYTTVLGLNPQIRDPGNVHAGDQIRLPTPRR
jgi:hypothetical protein